MKLSTATSILVNYQLLDAIDAVASSGFTGIDVWCGRPHLYRRDYSKEYLLKVAEKLKGLGLYVVSAMPAFFRYPHSLSSTVDNICQDSIAYMRDCIENAAIINAGHVLVVPSNNLYGQTVEDARKVFIRNLEKVCEIAQQNNVLLGVEVLNPQLSRFACTAAQVMGIIKEIGWDDLGLVLDTGHVNLSDETFEQALDIAGDRLMQIHINDNHGEEMLNAVPGEGNFDFVDLSRIIKASGYSGYLSLELGWHYSFDPEPVLREAIKMSRKLIDWLDA